VALSGHGRRTESSELSSRLDECLTDRRPWVCPSKLTVDSRGLSRRTNGRLEPQSGAEGEILDQLHQLERPVALHGVPSSLDDLVAHRGEAALELRYVLVGHEL
jgi:hypothetical protein